MYTQLHFADFLVNSSFKRHGFSRKIFCAISKTPWKLATNECLFKPYRIVVCNRFVSSEPLIQNVKGGVMLCRAMWTDLRVCFVQSAVKYSCTHCCYLPLFYSSWPKYWTRKCEDSRVLLEQFVSCPMINEHVENKNKMWQHKKNPLQSAGEQINF